MPTFNQAFGHRGADFQPHAHYEHLTTGWADEAMTAAELRHRLEHEQAMAHTSRQVNLRVIGRLIIEERV